MPARRRRPVMPGHQCVLLAALVTLASLASAPSSPAPAVPPLGDVLDRDAPNADADSNSLSICSAALAKACDERADMRLAGCRVCCGTHQHALRSAGCTADDCEDYCITHSSVGTPLKQRRSGVNVHRGGMPGDGAPSPAPEVMAKMCAAAQVTRNDAWWRYIEPIKGVYNFTNMDSWIATVRNTTGSACAAGPTEPMLMCAQARRAYLHGDVRRIATPPCSNLFSSALHFILEGGNHLWTGEDSTPPTTPVQVQAFTNFAVATITRYAGMGILWEIYNEADLRAWTPAQYGALFISVGKAVRASPAIARELLVGPSTSTVACGYVQALKHMGALDHADAVSVHAYCSGAPEQMRWQFGAMRNIVGPSTALLSGEWGWATCTANGAPVNCIGGTDPDVVSESDQAMYVARQWLVNALERIPISIYYDWTNDAHVIPGTAYDRTQWEMNAGITMEGDGVPKPAFNAAVAVQTFVGRRSFLAQLGNQTDMEYVLAFGATSSGPPPIDAAQQDLDGASAEVFVVWTLSAVGSTFHETGRGDSAYCGGDALWTGIADDCFQRCKETATCRGFVTYPTGTVHAGSNCQLTASRCTIPRPVKGCGINIMRADCAGGPDNGVGSNRTAASLGDACDGAVAHTVYQSLDPPPVRFALPVGARFRCYSAYDVLGAASLRSEVCADSDGTLTVNATEAPVYLVGKS